MVESLVVYVCMCVCVYVCICVCMHECTNKYLRMGMSKDWISAGVSSSSLSSLSLLSSSSSSSSSPLSPLLLGFLLRPSSSSSIRFGKKGDLRFPAIDGALIRQMKFKCQIDSITSLHSTLLHFTSLHYVLTLDGLWLSKENLYNTQGTSMPLPIL